MASANDYHYSQGLHWDSAGKRVIDLGTLHKTIGLKGSNDLRRKKINNPNTQSIPTQSCPMKQVIRSSGDQGEIQQSGAMTLYLMESIYERSHMEITT